jgi:hypothetical protein
MVAASYKLSPLDRQRGPPSALAQLRHRRGNPLGSAQQQKAQ